MTSVRCGKCGKNNAPEARFCIFCGSPLEIEAPETQQQEQATAEEIRQLRELVDQINSRLDALESRRGLTTAPPPPPPVPVPEPAELVAPEPEPLPEPVAAVPETEVPVTPVEAAPPIVKKRPAKKEGEWEQVLGGNWLARIGVLALIIGIGFFLKYAFDNNWLGPSARVILGVVVGLIMLGLGYYWRQRYPIMTRVLSGGGIAVLYLSIFASFATYNLISVYLAIAFLFIISGIATVLALRYDSMALAILGILGAFFAPFILGAFGDKSAVGGTRDQAIQLLVYIIMVDVGVLVLSTFRNWRWFTLLALACSLITYGFWYGEFNTRVGIAAEQIGITAIFLSFVGATYLFHITWRRTPRIFDYLLMLGNAGAYTGISLGIMWDELRAWMGGFVLLLTLFYGLLAYVAYKRNPEEKRLSRFSLAIALIFLTVAIPVQFRDHAATTIAWAAEGTALVWLAFKEKTPAFRFGSYIIFFMVVIRLLGFDTWAGGKTLTPVFNERFLAFIVSIALMWLAAYFLWKDRQGEKDGDYLGLIAAVHFLTAWIIGAEIYSYARQPISTSESLSLLILLIPAAGMVLNHMIWRHKPSRLDNVLAIFTAIAFIVINIFIWDDLNTWMGMAYIIPAIIFGILTWHAIKQGADYKKLGAFSLVVAFVFLTVAIPMQFRDHAATTIAWAVELVILVWLSFTLKLPLLRYCGYAVFAAMFWRMLIFDTTVEIADFKPVLNERFLAFILGIAAIYFVVYILWQRRDTITREWRVSATILAIAASFLTIWLISFEAWDSYSKSLLTAELANRKGLEYAQNLSLTAVWAVYAVAGLTIGIWRKWRWVRIGCLALLVIPIGKVFVYDVFNLETSYRIGAFVGLGVLLLVSAYLYQRYSKIIKGVFTSK